MKNKIGLLVCFLCILASVCVANASDETKNYIYKNDFSTLKDYVKDGELDYSSYASKNSMSIGHSLTNGHEVSIYNDGGTNGDGLFTSIAGSTTGASIKINKAYTPNKDVFFLEYDFKLPDENPIMAYSFPQIGSVVQSWVNLSRDTTNRKIDMRYYDGDVSGSNKWSTMSGSMKYGANNAVWYHFKYVYDFESFTYSIYVTSEDNSLTFSKENIKMRKADNFSVSTITFDSRYDATSKIGGGCVLDNIEIYTMKKLYLVSSSVADKQTDIPVEETMEFVFSDKIDDTTISSVTVSDLAVEDYTVTLKDEKTVAIAFNKNLDYNKTYAIDFNSLVSKGGVYASGATVTFTTENQGDVYISDYKLYKGFGEQSTEKATYIADDGFWYIDAQIENISSEKKDVALILAFYDSYGYMVKATYVDVSADSQSVVNAGTGTVIPSSYAGGFVKMFLWNDAGVMTPYTLYVKSNLQ